MLLMYFIVNIKYVTVYGYKFLYFFWIPNLGWKGPRK